MKRFSLAFSVFILSTTFFVKEALAYPAKGELGFMIFIGGACDSGGCPGIKGPVKEFYEANRQFLSYISKYYSWTQTSDIVADIKQKRKEYSDSYPIIIFGHSYGGDTAIEVVGEAKIQGITLVTIDPVGGIVEPINTDPSNRTREFGMSPEKARENKIIAAFPYILSWKNIYRA